MSDITKKKILLVDDEPDILNLVETVLHKEGFKNIIKADTGMDAVKICREKKPDIMVLDIMLPDLDGYEVCKQIREFSTIPILFLSAKSEEIDRLLSFALGGDDYITKPFSPKEVAYRIKAVLKRTQMNMEQKDNAIKVNNLEVYKEEGIVKKNGVDITLTAMEFKLLIYFVENKNIIISKNSLLENVWGSDFEGLDNTLMVHIRHLREKIEEDAGKPKYIQTVKKMGYKFVG